jgi:integrase
MAPDQDWTWLKAMSRGLLRLAKPNPKPVIPCTSAELQDVGLEVMKAADRAAKPSLDQRKPIPARLAIQHRNGLLIAVEALLPLRLRNVTLLELESSLRLIGAAWHICIPGSTTKNGDDIEAILPPEIGAALERHLAIYRSIFRKPGATKALWLSRNGRALSKVQLCAAFKKAVKAAAGIHISLHDVRDIAATAIAITRPEHVSVASDLLGHRDQKTTERVYILARGTEASRVMSSTIANLRKRGGKKKR